MELPFVYKYFEKLVIRKNPPLDAKCKIQKV